MVRWDAETLWQAIEPRLPGFTVEIVPEIDSTNTELMRRSALMNTRPFSSSASQLGSHEWLIQRAELPPYLASMTWSSSMWK